MDNYRRGTPVEDNMAWMLERATHLTIGPNPADGGWYCFVYLPDKRNWLARWLGPSLLVEGWGETPSDAVLSASARFNSQV